MSTTEIDAIRALLSSKPRPVGWAERRQRLDEVGSAWPVADDIRLDPVDLGGVPGEFSMAPGSDPSRVLMFFHGGGYCSGSIRSHRRMVTEAGRATRMRTLAVGYRLAPEHPYPAAHQDAMTAWRYLRRQGIAAGDIAVGGDSAGGNLTITLINRLRAAGEEQPACAWLASPWTDLTMSGATLASKDAVDPLIHKGYLEDLAAAYAPAPLDRKDASDLTAVRGPARVPADDHPGRFGGDAARRCRTLRGGRRRGRRPCDARSVAAHDPCLAAVERPPRGRPQGAQPSRRVRAALDRLEHDPEKCVAVFGKDHAPPRTRISHAPSLTQSGRKVVGIPRGMPSELTIKPTADDWRLAREVHARFAAKPGSGHIATEFALAHLAALLATHPVKSVLEFGSGIGTITSLLLERLPSDARIVCTEKNAFCREQFDLNIPAAARDRIELIPQGRPKIKERFDLIVVDGAIHGARNLRDGSLCFFEGNRIGSRATIEAEIAARGLACTLTHCRTGRYRWKWGRKFGLPIFWLVQVKGCWVGRIYKPRATARPRKEKLIPPQAQARLMAKLLTYSAGLVGSNVLPMMANDL